MNVVLSENELRRAAHDGVERRLGALRKKRDGAHGFDRDFEAWSIDVEGVAAEYVVAKALGVYFAPTVGALDTKLGDVMAGVQVRSSRYDDAHLLIHRTDSSDDRFVLVVGHSGRYRIAGWKYGGEAKDPALWKTLRGRSAFWIPQSELRPFEPRGRA